MSAHYRVTWEIDIFDADSPRDAAEQALAIQRRPGSIATCFVVAPLEDLGNPSGVVAVDLDEDEA
jgi:hypothetical protein